jgi:hypothetical protein
VPSAVFARVQQLATMRHTVAAFSDGEYHELWRQNGGQNVLAFSRGTGAGMRVVAICNQAQPCGAIHVPVAALADGTQLVDELGDGAPAQVTIANGALPLALPAKSAAIYRVAM